MMPPGTGLNEQKQAVVYSVERQINQSQVGN